MLLATLFLGVVVAYYLPEKDTALRTYNNIYIEKIRELKDFIINECKKHMTDDYLLQDFDIYLLSDVKMLNNKIELLTKYAKNEEIKNLWAFIGKQYSEYKAVTTTDIKATKRSIKLREKGILNLDLIINKLDEIELKLFNY